jgi:hypothetical protein
MRGEMFPCRSARGNRQHSGADGPRATDVVGSVPDDEDFLPGQMGSEQFSGAMTGDDGEFVAVLVIVGEGAGLKTSQMS